MQTQPYLFFDGNCEEAIEFYKRTLGAQVSLLMRYDETPDPHPPGMVPPGFDKKIMHATFKIGDSTIMAADDCQGHPNFQGFGLALAPKTEAEADRLFAALSDGGKVQMPLTKTFFSPKFGMLTDRFGLLWMINTTP